MDEWEAPSLSDAEIQAESAIAVWTLALGEAATGLDFANAEDRVSFRQEVGRLTANTRFDLVRELAEHFGCRNAGVSRIAATRALSDAWINRNYEESA